MPRVNERIRVREVRLIDHEGKQLGVKSIDEAMGLARSVEMDLVEVSPSAAPPVCKIMDFGKYKYELNKKSKENKKKQRTVVTKEIKLRPKIDDHDFDTKAKHAKTFLEEGHRVKAIVMFKGREVVYQDFGRKLLDRLAQSIAECCTIEKGCISEGRNLVSIFAPKAVVLPKPEIKKSDKDGEAPAAVSGAAEAETVSEIISEKPAVTEVKEESPDKQ
jgi:translation initiation factor IF-3